VGRRRGAGLGRMPRTLGWRPTAGRCRSPGWTGRHAEEIEQTSGYGRHRLLTARSPAGTTATPADGSSQQAQHGIVCPLVPQDGAKSAPLRVTVYSPANYSPASLSIPWLTLVTVPVSRRFAGVWKAAGSPAGAEGAHPECGFTSAIGNTGPGVADQNH